MNDRDRMVEAANEWIRTHVPLPHRHTCDIVPEEMADFALEQIAAERRRVLELLDAVEKGNPYPNVWDGSDRATVYQAAVDAMRQKVTEGKDA